jgi:transposase InsO family protein
VWTADFQFDATTDGRPIKIVSMVDEMAEWAAERVGLHFIPPGEPWRNGYIESFNARVRDECLNINIFWSLTQARVVISDWKDDYNHRRRHSALGYQAPAVYAAACTHR